MRLTDLEPEFLAITDTDTWRVVKEITQAQGVSLLCPACFLKNDGPVRTHSIICWFANRGVPDTLSPKPGRWNPEGNGLDDLSFVGPGNTSVLLMGAPCGAHFHIEKGEIRIC